MGRYSVLKDDASGVLVPDRFVSEPQRQNEDPAYWKGRIDVQGVGEMINLYNVRDASFVLPFDDRTTDVSYYKFPIYRVTQHPKSGSSNVYGLWDTQKQQWIVNPSEHQLTELSYTDSGEIIGRDSTNKLFSFTAEGELIIRSAAENAEQLANTRISEEIKALVKQSYNTDAEVTVVRLKKNNKTYPLFAAVASNGRKLWAFEPNKNLILEADLLRGLEASVENGQVVILERESKRNIRKHKTCIDETYKVSGTRFYCDPSNPGVPAAPQ